SRAPSRTSAVAHRPCRASLRPGLRSRLQHHRSVHRPAAQKARRRCDPHRARPRLQARRAERGRGRKLNRAIPRPNSLTFRLIAGAAVWSVLCLVIGGLVLSGIFRGAVQENLDDQLTFDFDGLIAAAEVDAPEHVTLQGRFADPRFERVFSGWYWQIEPDMGKTVDTQPETSRSLWDQTIVPQSL